MLFDLPNLAGWSVNEEKNHTVLPLQKTDQKRAGTRIPRE
jgi:hypothetical protein